MSSSILFKVIVVVAGGAVEMEMAARINFITDFKCRNKAVEIFMHFSDCDYCSKHRLQCSYILELKDYLMREVELKLRLVMTMRLMKLKLKFLLAMK